MRRRLIAAFAAAIVTAAGAVTAASPAEAGSVVTSSTAAASLGACTGPTGVTVVVDAGRLGGGVRIACASGSPATGIDALRSAGFAVRGTARFPGFVCRIDDVPADDLCLDTAPADAYWAYWHAPRGGTWTYSDTGASQRRPTSGGVEGWVFSDGSGRPPGTPPPPPSTPPVTAAPVGAPAPATGAASVAVGGATTVPPPGVAAPTGPTDAAATVPPTGGATPGPVDGAIAGPLDGAAPPPTIATPLAAPPPDAGTSDPGDNGASDRTAPSARPDAELADGGTGTSAGDTGSPVGTVAGVAVVAAVAAVAVTTYRRRRAGSAPGHVGP